MFYSVDTAVLVDLNAFNSEMNNFRGSQTSVRLALSRSRRLCIWQRTLFAVCCSDANQWRIYIRHLQS